MSVIINTGSCDFNFLFVLLCFLKILWNTYVQENVTIKEVRAEGRCVSCWVDIPQQTLGNLSTLLEQIPCKTCHSQLMEALVMTPCAPHHVCAFLDLGFDFQPPLFILKHPFGSYLLPVNHAPHLPSSAGLVPDQPPPAPAQLSPGTDHKLPLKETGIITQAAKEQGKDIQLSPCSLSEHFIYKDLPPLTDPVLTRSSQHWFPGRSLRWHSSLTSVQSIPFFSVHIHTPDSARWEIKYYFPNCTVKKIATQTPGTERLIPLDPEGMLICK